MALKNVQRTFSIRLPLLNPTMRSSTGTLWIIVAGFQREVWRLRLHTPTRGLQKMTAGNRSEIPKHSKNAGTQRLLKPNMGNVMQESTEAERAAWAPGSIRNIRADCYKRMRVDD
jgi:hypothetical protein